MIKVRAINDDNIMNNINNKKIQCYINQQLPNFHTQLSQNIYVSLAQKKQIKFLKNKQKIEI